MAEIILLTIIDILAVAVLFLWGVVLSTDEYPRKKHEMKYHIGSWVALGVFNVLYSMYIM